MSSVKRIFNCKKDCIDHRDYILKIAIPESTALASSTIVDLRSLCPPIYDQGDLGSCVSNGTGSAIQFYQNKTNSVHKFMPSRLFMYYNTRVIENSVSEDNGTTIRDCLISVNKTGVCPETLWPYTISQFAIKPPTIAYTSASAHLVKTYTRIILDLNQMKQCLIDGYPFIFGIELYSSFYDVGSNGLVSTPSTSDELLGGHCMACVGFDDSKSVFIVRNSWGTSWGDAGYCYIPYNYLNNSTYTSDLWTIRNVSDTEVTPVTPTGTTLTNIKSVVYGKHAKIIDVTNIFINYFKTHAQLKIENSIFGEPYYGVVKQLKITFTNAKTLIYNEHQIIQLATLLNNTTIIVKASNVISAFYGNGNTQKDVTTIVKDYFSKGNLSMIAGNIMFGDPIYGVVKTLTITLISGNVKTVRENSVLSLEDLL